MWSNQNWPTNRPHPNCQIWDWLDLKKGVVKNVPRELITFSRSSSSTKISFLLFFIWLWDHMPTHIWMWVLEMAGADWRLICLTWYHVEWRHHVWSLTSSLKPCLFASLDMFLKQLSATFTLQHVLHVYLFCFKGKKIDTCVQQPFPKQRLGNLK